MGRVLVVGGTGPTGPHVLRGLVDRGHDVTIFHRGVHEPADLVEVEHLHGDPHFRDAIDEALAGRSFDLVLAMYGRVAHLAAALVGRCERFLAIGGVPVYSGYFPVAGAPALPLPVTEDHPVVTDVAPTGAVDPALRFSRRLAEAEEAVRELHPTGTLLRFPMIYGPFNARPHEWSVLRRVRDGRRHMVLPDGGLQVHTRCAARNAAAAVLAAVDHPDAAAGQVFNCGDPENWSLRRWVELLLELLGAEMELVAVPSAVAVDATSTLLPLAGTTSPHCVLSTEKLRRELGHTPVVEPDEALRETLAWYDTVPDPGAAPAMTDRFDYATEDALVDAYRAAQWRIGAEVEQRAAPPVHSMPHPTAPGGPDHRGR
jgi:nucleoside-diphosphate-sugar epimerase